MALHNPSGIYQGQAPLNPLPYVNIALQQRARKQAREQAIDQYYQKLPDTVNDKGVRDQEIPLINDYKNKIFEFGLKNKEALRNPKIDNGAAQFNLQKLMKEAQGVARQSQELGRRGLERGKMYLSKEGRWAVDDDEFMTAEELESLPLNDPRHQKMDMPKLLSNRPFDEKEFGTEIKGKVKYGTKTQTTNDPDNPLYDIVSEVPTLDENAKKGIYAFAAEKINGNKRFENFIKNKTPEQLAVLGQIYKDNFGKEPTEDEDFAAGYVISQLPISSTKQKRQQDVGAVTDKKFAQQKAMEDYKQANREKLLGMREAAKAAGDEQNNLWVENYIDRLTADAEVSNIKGWAINKNGQRIKENRIQLDPLLAKLLTKDGVSPDQFAVQPNGQFRPIFYKRKDGVVQRDDAGNAYVDEIASVPMSKEQFKLLLGGKAGVKQLNKEMVKPNQKTKITVKKGELDDIQ